MFEVWLASMPLSKITLVWPRNFFNLPICAVINKGPVHMFSVHDPGKMFSEQVLGTRAFRLRGLWNVLGTPSFRFKIGTHLGLRSMTYCVYIHCATCEVILMCTLHADSGLRAKPCPLRTCSRFHIVQTSFRRRTRGAICSENMLWPCSSWNCSSGNTTL